MFSWFVWPPVLKNKGTEGMAEILGQPMNTIERALWEITLVNKFNFLPEYRESIGLGNPGANPHLH